MPVNLRRQSSLVASLFITVVLNLANVAFADESRYERWQQGRPFTIGAMYYDGPYGAPAQLPAPEDAHPDMDMFRYAGLNLLDEVSWSMGGHERYPGASAAQEAGIPFMILGAALQEDAEEAMNAFQSHATTGCRGFRNISATTTSSWAASATMWLVPWPRSTQSSVTGTSTLSTVPWSMPAPTGSAASVKLSTALAATNTSS